MNELKPCPFCGSEDIYVVSDRAEKPTEFAVGCKTCRFAETRAQAWNYYDAEAAAKQAWNRRANNA